jgi:hypothetical protein
MFQIEQLAKSKVLLRVSTDFVSASSGFQSFQQLGKLWCLKDFLKSLPGRLPVPNRVLGSASNASRKKPKGLCPFAGSSYPSWTKPESSRTATQNAQQTPAAQGPSDSPAAAGRPATAGRLEENKGKQKQEQGQNQNQTKTKLKPNQNQTKTKPKPN